jgi:hypothetical protein
MRRWLLALIVVSTPLVVAAPVNAMPPVRELIIYEDFTLTDHCSFDVFIHIVQNNVVLTTFLDQQGNVTRQLADGVLKIQVTNATAPDKTLLLNISGPGEFTVQPDGSILTVGWGPWLNFGVSNFPGELLYSHGRLEAVLTADGEYILTQIPNDAVNICGLIA